MKRRRRTSLPRPHLRGGPCCSDRVAAGRHCTNTNLRQQIRRQPIRRRSFFYQNTFLCSISFRFLFFMCYFVLSVSQHGRRCFIHNGNALLIKICEPLLTSGHFSQQTIVDQLLSKPAEIELIQTAREQIRAAWRKKLYDRLRYGMVRTLTIQTVSFPLFK